MTRASTITTTGPACRFRGRECCGPSDQGGNPDEVGRWLTGKIVGEPAVVRLPSRRDDDALVGGGLCPHGRVSPSGTHARPWAVTRRRAAVAHGDDTGTVPIRATVGRRRGQQRRQTTHMRPFR